MAKVSPIQSSFKGGEFSPLAYGRVDVDRYRSALELCENYVPFVQGGITSRPGTRYVAKAKDSSKKVRVVAFEFSTTQAYILEFGHQTIRFYKDHGQITLTAQNVTGITKANPAVLTYNGSDTYANGDRVYVAGVGGMTQVNNREFTVANVNAGANTFELSGVNSTAYGTYTSGGTVAEIYEIASPYDEADLFELKFAQSADVLYIAHPSYAPRTLSRTAHTSWTLTAYTAKWGPFLAENLDEAVTVTASAATGSGITLTASANLFNANHVGAKWQFREVLGAKYQKWAASTASTSGDYRYYEGRLYRSGTTATTGTNPPIHTTGAESDGAVTWTYIRGDRGYATITGYTNATLVTADVVETLPASATSGIFTWAEGAWSADEGYPSAVTFYEDRLWWGGTTGRPQSLWATATGEYDDFRAIADSGDVTAAEALSLTLNANDVNAVRWLADDERALVIGTSGGEWTLKPFTSTEALSATNVSATRSTTHGCANLAPIRSDRAALFVQRAGRKLRELAYVFEADGFRAPDLTVHAEHITEGGVVEMAQVREPQPIVWMARSDGKLIGLTYSRDEDMVAWHRHTLGGSGIVESVAAIPAPDGTYDELWAVVRRTINGASVRYVEYMERFFSEATAQEDAYYVDCGLTYDSTPTATLTGLFHLEGETVALLADGAAHPNVTVSGGAVTLNRSASVVHVGYYANRNAKPLHIEAGAQDGTSQGKTQRITNLTLRFYQTLGCQVGRDENNLQAMPFRDASDDMGAAVPLFSGDKKVDWEGDYETGAHIYIRQPQPLPSTILAIIPQLVTQDRG